MRHHGMDSKLEETLRRWEPTSRRDPHAAARGRARFLAEAAQLTSARRFAPRLAWNLAFSVLVALVLFFGSSAGLAFAAQESLPDEPLYPLKLWSEDFRVRLAGDPQAKIDLLMQFSDRRVGEMDQLAMRGRPISLSVAQRFEYQIQQALELAASLDDEALQQAVQRIRARCAIQEQRLLAEPGPAQPVRQWARARLQEQLQWLDANASDPQAFRRRFHRGQDQPAPSLIITPSSSPIPIELNPASKTALPENTPTPRFQEANPGRDGSQGSGGKGKHGPHRP